MIPLITRLVTCLSESERLNPPINIVVNNNTDARSILLIFNWREPIFIAADEKAKEVPDQRNAVSNALNSPIILIYVFQIFVYKKPLRHTDLFTIPLLSG